MGAASQIWFVDLERAADALWTSEQDTPRLSSGDHVRLNAVQDPSIQRHRRATYIAQRLALEAMFGPTIRQADLPRDALGRPHLPPGHVGSHSLAHTGTFALIAVTSTGRIGVDLEAPRTIRMSTPRRLMIEAAAATLSADPYPTDPDARFLQAWTRLEALAKADGHGIGHILTAIGAVGGKPPIPEAAAALAAAHGLTIHDLPLSPSLYAAVASPDTKKPALHLWPAGLATN